MDADAIGSIAAMEHAALAHRLLARHLLPHIVVDEAVRYPAIERDAECNATATMRRDHDTIRAYTAQLDAAVLHPSACCDNHLRAALAGLDAIVHLHVATAQELRTHRWTCASTMQLRAEPSQRCTKPSTRVAGQLRLDQRTQRTSVDCGRPRTHAIVCSRSGGRRSWSCLLIPLGVYCVGGSRLRRGAEQ